MAKKKYIETPEKFWNLFLGYKKHTKENPIIIKDWVGKDANTVYREKERPLTIEGFENYVADIDGMPMDLGDYFANTNQKYSDYSTICTRVKRTIRQNQIEGGMASIFNPSITQRLNNLVDRQETTLKEQPLFGNE